MGESNDQINASEKKLAFDKLIECGNNYARPISTRHYAKHIQHSRADRSTYRRTRSIGHHSTHRHTGKSIFCPQ